MINRQQLLADLKPLLRELENDLRTRCDEVAQINADLTKEYEQARAANRAGITFEEWRADLITQVAVAWVLSSVFVRFLEDNGLSSPPRISGPQHGPDGQGLMRARDERDVFFRQHPTLTDRDYLLSVFDDLAKLTGTKDVFGPYNPVSTYRDWLSGDAAQKLIEFFQKIDADGTGEIICDFADDQWDTRFLGDLYQDLSEAARKKYALLQTPIFVEEFILDRTLEPAIKEFGLKDFKMIDPACGSGHFVLGSFARILNHWRKTEPGTNDRELVNRTLASVHGVDLNPYAVAIARFRLLLMAMRECRVVRLKDAPNFQFNLVCGDSLLHGSTGQQVLGFHELAHHYQSEDIGKLRRILAPSQYHAVVANPPYITVKDSALNQAYRERFSTCHMKYSLAVPFAERLFQLARRERYSGQITANSFLKCDFGVNLIEKYLPTQDLTHLIDTSLAHIPGHGIPTVILLGRSRPPISPTVRCVANLKREDGQPEDPSHGTVWNEILRHLNSPGVETEFVSVLDTSRELLAKHPVSLASSAAISARQTMDSAAVTKLGKVAISIGFMAITGSDEALVTTDTAAKRQLLTSRPFLTGDGVRDWHTKPADCVLYPYRNTDLAPIDLANSTASEKFLWPRRTTLAARSSFGKTMEEHGLRWFEYIHFIHGRVQASHLLVYAVVSTHNQFAIVRRGLICNPHAPVILFATENEGDAFGKCLIYASLLNSSAGSFWMKQVFRDRGGGGIGGGIAAEAWERFTEHTGTKLKEFPIPSDDARLLAKRLDILATQLMEEICPPKVISASKCEQMSVRLAEANGSYRRVLCQMIAIQEELDWRAYRLYGFVNEDLTLTGDLPEVNLGERAFEIVLARKVKAGKEETTWFARHGSTPIAEIPVGWPDEYKKVVQRRIELIESNRDIALIERPEYKRRWNLEPWEQQKEHALRNWLLDRLESYFDLDGRMNDERFAAARGALQEPRLINLGNAADLAKQDKDFMQLAELYSGCMDFDVTNLVGDLIDAESMPCLPILRYKPGAMDKRAAWERTWDLQRLEDAVDSIFEMERLKKIEPGKAEETLNPLVAALRIEEQIKPAILREAINAAGYVAEAMKQGVDPLNLVTNAAKRAKQRAAGDIPVPPKYTSADFLSSSFWRLRGKLDVPKERWVSFPHCEGEDGTLLIAWAGYDHLQLARAIAEHYEHAREHEGRKLVPLLACIGQLIPWLKQWHNELDPIFGTRMGDYFENYLAEESKALGMNADQAMAWTPPAKARKAGRNKKVEA